MKKIGFSLALLLAGIFQSAGAAVQVTEGNVLQASCNFPSSLDDIRSVGTLTPGKGNLVKNKKVSTGKLIATGDVVFYAQLEKSSSFYSSKKAAEIKDKSPFTPDKKLDADRKYPVWAYYTMKNGKKFAILDIRGYTMPVVNEDGFLCSDVIMEDKGMLKSVGMPQAFQEIPFERVEEPVGDGNTTAIAITFKEFDAVSFTFDVAILNNGRVVSRKIVGFDLLSGQADIGGLIVEVGAAGKASIKIKSIAEPLDYAVWMKRVFNI